MVCYNSIHTYTLWPITVVLHPGAARRWQLGEERQAAFVVVVVVVDFAIVVVFMACLWFLLSFVAFCILYVVFRICICGRG